MVGNRKVAIVGAGIGGLAAGYWLRQRGYDVEIWEASDRPGGRMILLEHNGDRVDIGAQFYHSNFRYAFQLMEAMGLSSSRRPISGNIQYALKDGSTYIYDRRFPYMKLLGVYGNLRMYWFTLKHLILGLRIPKGYTISKDIPEFDDIEVFEEFNSVSDRVLRDFFVNVLCMGASSALPEWMSFYSYAKNFRNVLFPGYATLTGGIASLAEQLAKRLPVRYGSPVRTLVMEKGRVVGVQLEKDGSVSKAGHVIVATTPPAAVPLLPDEMLEQRRFLESVTYVRSPMPIFFLDRPLDKNIWCYFNDPRLRKTYGYVVDALSKAPEMIQSGKSALVGFAIHPMSEDLMDKPDDIVLKIAREEFELMIPGFSKWVEDVKIHRHAFVNALYPPGAFHSVLEFLKSTQNLRGVSFVSSVLCGEAMEGALTSAASAVKRVCGWGGMP